MKAIHALIPALLISMPACRPALPSSTTAPTQADKPAQALPMTLVYLTNGDYADNVPVTMDQSGKSLASYPDPHDIHASSRPIKLAEGWLLDRRGISSTSVFLDYTYKEYAALESCPSPDELMKHVIKGSCVTEIRQLPLQQWQAVDDPVEASKLVDNAMVVYVMQAE